MEASKGSACSSTLETATLAIAKFLALLFGMETDALIKSLSIDNMLNQREGVADLVRRAHCVLDGKPEPDVRDGVGAQIRKLHTHHRSAAWAGDYFSVKWFKKGTAHLAFKRPDLVEQMNKILAKHYPGALASTAGGNGG